MTVYFIGAGPGDPELITVKGQRLIQQCPVILYAGSLVPEAVLAQAAADATVINTAELHLDQIVAHIEDAARNGQDVARVHSGDPCLYGATGEQMRRLDALGIDYEIIPGVSAYAASAAILKRELTLPNVSQSIILTRVAGKTDMPDRESLSRFAEHQATMAIHLGVTRIHKIVEQLVPHYGEDCPVAVVYRASWPDQDYVVGTLSDITDKVREKGFTRTALVLVGRVIAQDGFDESFLYNEEKPHIFRPRSSKKTA